MPNLSTVGIGNDAYNIESYIFPAVVIFNVFIGQPYKRLSLLVVHGLFRLQDAVVGATFHFYNDQFVPIQGNEINLQMPTTVVMLKDNITQVRQESCRHLFTCLAEFQSLSPLFLGTGI